MKVIIAIVLTAGLMIIGMEHRVVHLCETQGQATTIFEGSINCSIDE